MNKLFGFIQDRLVRNVIIIFITGLIPIYCQIDFSGSIRELGDRYQAKIIAFYEEHQRSPTLDESRELRLELGCKLDSSIYDKYICGGFSYVIEGVGGYLNNEEVSFQIKRAGTFCNYRFKHDMNGNVTINEKSCRQRSCFSLRQ